MKRNTSSRIYGVPWLESGKGFELIGEGVEPGSYEDVVSIVSSLGMRMPSLDELISLFFEYYPHPDSFPMSAMLWVCYPIFSREVFTIAENNIQILSNPEVNKNPDIIIPFKKDYFGRTEKEQVSNNLLLKSLIQKANLDKLAKVPAIIYIKEEYLNYFPGFNSGRIIGGCHMQCDSDTEENDYKRYFDLGLSCFANLDYGYTFAVFD